MATTRQEEIDKTVETFNSAAAQAVIRKIDFCFNAIVTRIENNVLPEDIFVNVFLPYFSGEVEVDENSDVIVQWISIAGSPSREVTIIDENSKPLFTVPALLDSSGIDIMNKNKGQSFNNIAANYFLHKNQLPIIGQNYLNTSLEKRVKSLNPEETKHDKTIKQWIYILRKYNKLGQSASEVVDNSSKLGDDEFEYD